MRKSLLLFAGLALFGATGIAETQRATTSQEAVIRAYWSGCPFHDERLPDPEIKRRHQDTLRLDAILANGPGDPLGDARRAIDAGDFRLVWSSSMGGQAVLGAVCRFPQYHPSHWPTPFTLATIGFSDVPGSCRDRPNGCEIDARFGRYALSYNRAIIGDPRFPYPDLCTFDPPSSPHWRQPMLDDLGGLAAPSAAETDHPRTLAEAMRHGTRPTLSRWIKRANRIELDSQDDFALTPLAWAAIEGRTEAASMLIARGADPLAGCAPVRGFAHTVPLKIALQLGRNDIVQLMLRPDVKRRLKPWPASLIEAAVRGDQVALVRQMLREEHERVFAQHLFSLANENGSSNMIAVLSEGTENGGEAMLAVAISKQDLALLRQALAMKPPVNSGRDPRQSPLGSAVLNGGETTDQIVRLLLDHGADPESPVQWETSHPSGSQPNTALVALVTNAQRIPRGHADDKISRVMASQLRALDMLLAARASIRAKDDNGRPLAVLMAVGRYGQITRQELPVAWLRRLVAGGMDVNETWQGSSALDWLDKMQMGNSEMALAIVALGGRRIVPVASNMRF